MSPLDLLFYEVETGMRYVEVPAGEDVADPLSRTASAGSARFRWVRVAEPVAVEDDFCLLHYKMFKDAAGRTAKSILVSCNTRMEPFAIPQVRELVSYDEMELDKLGDADCRRAVFAIVSDTSGLCSFLLAIMMWQAVNVLCRRALSRYGGALPTHVSFLLDEFANIGRLPDIERTIAVVRSRNVSMTVYLQSMSQLKSRYKDPSWTAATPRSFWAASPPTPCARYRRPWVRRRQGYWVQERRRAASRSSIGLRSWGARPHPSPTPCAFP